MSKSFEEMNLSEFVEYYEYIANDLNIDLNDSSILSVRALEFLKMFRDSDAKIYTQAELNAAVAKSIKEMTEVLEAKVEELKALRVKLVTNSEEDSWIKVSYREMTREEVEEFGGEAEWMYDCNLPEDNTEVLITSAYGDVEKVEFCRDVDGACWFEGYEDFDDVIAWMPVPEPYKEGHNNDNQ